MSSLPLKYIENMKNLLGEEYPDYEASFSMPRKFGLRVNTSKISIDDFTARIPFPVSRIEFTKKGFFYNNDFKPAKHPYYYAGLYYLQEPSAMLPADRLEICPGDRVLDLCAAPGGKSTAILDKLNGTGFLLANDISAARASVMVRNFDLMGFNNYCITAETPERLSHHFSSFFDKILVDAPCSGEGMFRKDSALIDAWNEHGPEYYSEIQHEIMQYAVRMLKPGGLLMYSTCTFSPKEDEETIQKILDENNDIFLTDIEGYKGFIKGIGLEKCVRIFPHKIEGEGHFLALLKKTDNSTAEMISDKYDENRNSKKISNKANRGPSKSLARVDEKMLNKSDFDSFERYLNKRFDRNRLYMLDSTLYLMPDCFDEVYKKSIRYVRTGCPIGDFDKHLKFEPSQALAMLLSKDEYSNYIDYSKDDEQIIRYLKGETLFTDNPEIEKGYVLMLVDGFPLGFTKNINGQLRNKYKISWKME